MYVRHAQLLTGSICSAPVEPFFSYFGSYFAGMLEVNSAPNRGRRQRAVSIFSNLSSKLLAPRYHPLQPDKLSRNELRTYQNYLLHEPRHRNSTDR